MIRKVIYTFSAITGIPLALGYWNLGHTDLAIASILLTAVSVWSFAND